MTFLVVVVVVFRSQNTNIKVTSVATETQQLASTVLLEEK